MWERDAERPGKRLSAAGSEGRLCAGGTWISLGYPAVPCQPPGMFPSCRSQVAGVCKIGTSNSFVKLAGMLMLGTVGRCRKRREYLSKCGLLRRGVSEQHFPLSAWSLGQAAPPWGARRVLAAGFLRCAGSSSACSCCSHRAAAVAHWGDEPSSRGSGCSAGAQSWPRAGQGVCGTVGLPVRSRG